MGVIVAKYAGIEGEWAGRHHQGWVGLERFEWGADPADPRGRPGRIGADARDVVLSFRYDKAGIVLEECAFTGREIPSLVVELSEDDDAARPYLRYEFDSVIVVDFSVSAALDDDQPLVTVTNNVMRVTATYTEYDSAGMVVGRVEYTHDASRDVR